MLTHTLLELQALTAADDGWTSSAIAVGGRTRWFARALIAWLDPDPGSSITLQVTGSPTGDEDDWYLLHEFTALAVEGSVEVRVAADEWSDRNPDPDLDVYMRVELVAVVGSVCAGVVIGAPFVDPTLASDQDLFSKELREWSDGFVRTVVAAEEDILALITRRPLGRIEGDWRPPVLSGLDPLSDEFESGEPVGQVLSVDPALPGFGPAVRQEIASQAEHRFHLERLRRDPKSEGHRAYRDLGLFYAGAGQRVARFKNVNSVAWRGR